MSITGMGYGLSSPYSGLNSSTGQLNASLGNLNPSSAYSSPAASNPMSGLLDATGGSGLSGNNGMMGMIMQIMSLMISMLSMLMGGLGGNSPANPQSLLATGGGTDAATNAGNANPSGAATPSPAPTPAPTPSPAPSPSGTTGTDGSNGAGDSQPPSGDVGSWISQAQQALAASGISMDKMNTQDIATIIQHESSGDPNAINLTDGNAQAGHPSIGLMQTIQPTFDDNKLPGHDNIRNPVDNIIAAVRYAVKTYGSVSDVPGVKNVKEGKEYVGY